MARPLSPSDTYRNGSGYPGAAAPTYGLAAPNHDDLQELEQLRLENAQFRQLCAELEQALAEATQASPESAALDERFRDYEALLESKDETIRSLHLQLQETQQMLEEAACKPNARRSGPVPREEEMLALSEELERERRQLQEDEQSLMEQMRQMELSMARERAEMARQRNDLQRLAGEIRHDLERLERNGALQSKMDELRAKFQDATTRRGAAPANSRPGSSANLPNLRPGTTPPADSGNGGTNGGNGGTNGNGGFLGRFFGGK
jgi:chromosome segregation ATPase